MIDLAYREWIFNIKNKPQVGKDPNNYNKPERNINEFEQVPIKEKKIIAAITKVLAVATNNNNNKKNIEKKNLKNKWTLNRKEKEKTLKIKK